MRVSLRRRVFLPASIVCVLAAFPFTSSEALAGDQPGAPPPPPPPDWTPQVRSVRDARRSIPPPPPPPPSVGFADAAFPDGSGTAGPVQSDEAWTGPVVPFRRQGAVAPKPDAGGDGERFDPRPGDPAADSGTHHPFSFWDTSGAAADYEGRVQLAQQALGRPRQFVRRWHAYPMLDSMPRRWGAASQAGTPGPALIGHEDRAYPGSIAVRGDRLPNRYDSRDTMGGALARNIPEMGYAGPRPQSMTRRRADMADGVAPENYVPEALQLFGTRVPWYAGFSSTVMFGASSTDQEQLEFLQRATNDPKTKGFALQQITGAIGGDLFDEWLGGDAKFDSIWNPESSALERFSLEQASLWSEFQPGMALAAGVHRAPFGIHNMYASNAWLFVDSPVIRTRLLGDSGLNSLGASFAYHDVRRRVRFQVGAQDLETNASGLMAYSASGLGGIWATVDKLKGDNFAEVIWHGRIAHVVRLGACGAMQMGGSLLYGPNFTGDDGHTTVAGCDVRIDFVDASRQSIQTSIVAEAMYRYIRTDAVMVGSDLLPKDELEDWGFYIQGVHSVSRFLGVGVRYDFATGSHDSFKEFAGGVATFTPRDMDPARHDRQRISVLGLVPIRFNNSSAFFTNAMKPALRLRVQYSYDRAKYLAGDDSHTIWVGFDTDVASQSN